MAHRFNAAENNGKYPSGEGLDLYNFFPRKLEALPLQGGLDGWGLYFVETEGFNFTVKTGKIILVVILVLAFGIRNATTPKYGFATGVALSAMLTTAIGVVVVRYKR
jgi:hypothetical protein